MNLGPYVCRATVLPLNYTQGHDGPPLFWFHPHLAGKCFLGIPHSLRLNLLLLRCLHLSSTHHSYYIEADPATSHTASAVRALGPAPSASRAVPAPINLVSSQSSSPQLNPSFCSVALVECVILSFPTTAFSSFSLAHT